jgi:predicted helicase
LRVVVWSYGGSLLRAKPAGSEGPDTVGVIFVNEAGASGGITLSSRDRTVSQVMTFKLQPKPTDFPGDELSAFLASYRFNVNRPITEDEAAAMIVGAGVPLSEDATKDCAAE